MYVWIRFPTWEISYYYTQNKLYLTSIQRFIYFQIKISIVDKTVSLYWKNNRQITCLSWRTFNCVGARFWNRLNKKKIHTPDSILTRLNNPVSVATGYWYVADRHWIEYLIYLSIATNLVAMRLRSILHTFFCSHSTISILFHTYLLPSSPIKYKIDNYNLFLR